MTRQGGNRRHEPRRELVHIPHVLHNFFQSFPIFDVHLIAYFAFPVPIVDHGAKRALQVGGALWGLTQGPFFWEESLIV